MKLIHITDTHVVNPGHTLYGLDPSARLSAAVDDINTHHADAALAVVTGDLTHWGEPQSYAAFKAAMQELNVPYVAMVGNHDRRLACLNALPAAPRDDNGFVQGFRDTPQGRLIFLDTLDETSHGGQMCAQRLGWLSATLEQTPRLAPLVIFMHHPPFSVGIHEMDQIALHEREQFTAVLRPYMSRVRHLFHGHVHRPISGSWRGIPFSTLRGTNHQVAFDLSQDGEHMASHEPPAYAVVLFEADQIMVHTNDYLDRSARMPFSKAGVDERTYVLGTF